MTYRNTVTVQSNKLHLVPLCLQLLLLILLGHSVIGVPQNIVRILPGFDGALPFELETGYVNVEELNDVNLFYYFVKSERNPTEDPLLVWISGGPGCSVLTALAFEIGPLLFKKERYNGGLPKLELNPHSWTKVANILFLDAPVEAGFSYSGSNQGRYTGDIKTAEQAHVFIRKWLSDHPEYLSNPLYIGGDSYSGMTVPVIVQHVSDGIGAGEKPLINLKGYILGNPLADNYIETNSKIPFSHGMGLISDALFESMKQACGGDYVNADRKNALCAKHLDVVLEVISGINTEHILEPTCALASPKPKKIIRQRSSLEKNTSGIILSPAPYPKFECRSYAHMLSYYWANNDRVQQALNIRKGTVQEWVRCPKGSGVTRHYSLDVRSAVGYHFNLSQRHYRSLIYSGDHDLIVPLWSTQYWIRSLNYSISDEWRAWLVGGQVAGYTMTYTNNMTYATVKGAGHTAPEYKPKECFALLKRWLAKNSL